MLGEGYWQARGFQPIPFLKSLRMGIAYVLGIAVVSVASGLLGTAIPFGLAALVVAERARRRKATSWVLTLAVRREDHPDLFRFIVGLLYAVGVWAMALGLYQLGGLLGVM
ncbi:MAG: hypothetical protein HKN04_13380 [Rhodothermaceae bacterium]|nr:hypothetical protein [Rhodothermaceae bacterium]